MKKIYNILLLALAAAFTSCTGLVDDIFDTSSANRAAETMEANREVLMSAPNGWRLTMKADPNDEFGIGAYNLFIKFNADSTVSVSSDKEKADSVITSHFKLYQSEGINLSFDEHNPFIHYFSDPVNSDGFGQAGKGLKGDFEFFILKATKDEVILKGKKSSVKMTMVPVEAGKAWKDEIEYIQTVSSQMCKFKTYDIAFKDTTVRISRSYRSFTYTDKEGNKFIYPFNVTKNGIEFLEPATFSGRKITGFTYKNGVTTYEANDGTGTTISPFVSNYESLIGGEWYMAKSLMSEKLSAAFDNCVALSEGEGEVIQYAALYKANNTQLCLQIQSGNYISKFNFNFTKIDEDNLTLKIASITDNNASWYYNNGYSPFIDLISGTYNITPDNQISPTLLTLTKKEDPTVSFTISAAAIMTPAEK